MRIDITLTRMNKEKNDFISIKNDKLEITFSSLGASLYRVKYDGKDMILTPKEEKEFYREDVYFGKSIGRVCGRLVSGNHGSYNFEDNENGVSLHGGHNGLSTKNFDYALFDKKIIFRYTSKDGEAGYPGNLTLVVTYELQDNSLLLKYFAKTDKPCLLALTNHTYFCLGESEKDKLSLKFDSDKYIKVDSKLLPVSLEKVPEKWNFLLGKSLSETGDIDNSFLLNKKVINLYSNKYELKIETDYDATQIFTDHFENDFQVLTSGRYLYRGVAIEPQDNQLERKELLQGESYERFIKYTFTKL